MKESSLPAAVLTASGQSVSKQQFSFGSFRLEADGTLFRGDTPVHLPPRELAALQFLLEHAGQIVTPLQLKQALWGDVHVSADSVPKCLSSLRARLEPEECIQTVYKRGYRFTADTRAEGASQASALPRLVITPFTTLYGVPEHLGMAVAEETIARLTGARSPAVSVLARDSIFTLANRGLAAQQIGETLKADLVLAGTLRALPSHFRLRAEMIRVKDGIQIWVEDLLVERSRFAGLESELVNRLAFRLNTGAPGDDQRAPIAPPGLKTGIREARETEPVSWDLAEAPHSASSQPASLLESGAGSLSISAAGAPFVERRKRSGRREAYEYYQRGHHEWQTLQRHRMQDGLQYLTRAIELDPSLFAARVDLVNLCVTQAFYGFMSPAVAADLVRRTAESAPPAPGFPRVRPLHPDATAKAAGRRGAESIPDLPPGSEAILPALGWIKFHVDHNLPAALWAFSASDHLPHDTCITRLRVMFTLSRHRFDEAIAFQHATLQLDPYSPSLHARLAWALHLASRAAESLECIRHALDLFPEDEYAQMYGTMILAFNGDAARAIPLALDLVQRSPDYDLATAAYAYALACAGNKAEALAVLERMQWMSRERFVLSSFTPAAYVALGNHDAALTELHNAAQARCPWFFQTLADPRLKPLHSYPEFKELRSILTRMEASIAERPQIEL